MTILTSTFFDRDAQELAQLLLGKVIYMLHDRLWLKAKIIETEAYYLHEKASHASLGYTEKRKALFMPAGTIYMYYARGGDSMNISARGEGNAVLIKSAIPYLQGPYAEAELLYMQALNPAANGQARTIEKLCAGQTLLCKSLGIKVIDWDQKIFDPQRFFIKDVGYKPSSIIQTTRLGIPTGRDGHLPYRFIDHAYVRSCTSNPLTKRGESKHQVLKPPVADTI